MNIAIVRAKDLIKCIILIIGIAILIIAFNKIKDKNLNKIAQLEIKEEILKKCIEISIPGINQKIIDENKEEGNYIQPLYLGLNQELRMALVLEKKLNEEENEINEEQNEKKEESNKDNSEIKEVPTEVNTQVLESKIQDKSNLEYKGVLLRNESCLNIDFNKLDEEISINKKEVIIFHTHTCESYTSSEQYSYQMTGNFRTTDLEYTVSAVGDELKKNLDNLGFKVYHDKSYNDYPSYTGSYGNSLEKIRTLKQTEEEYKDTDILIDIHRDAIGSVSDYSPLVKINDEEVARLMFVIGTNGGGLEHEKWQENLKFAVKVQEKANKLYPGLFKPIIIRNSRYNQHLGKAAVIIEVGATGNKLEQTKASMKYLSKVLFEVLK